MKKCSGDICRVVKSGAIMLDGHKYKADELKRFNGEKVVIILSIKDIMETSILTMDGKFICKAKRV